MKLSDLLKLSSSTTHNVLSLFSVAILLLSGCATTQTYSQGSATSKTDLITLTCDSETNLKLFPGANRTVTITKLDGKNVGSSVSELLFGAAGHAPGIDLAYVIAGRHELVLHWRSMNTYANMALWFNAEAGKSYAVRWKSFKGRNFLDPGSTDFWIEEVATGKHVGGVLE